MLLCKLRLLFFVPVDSVLWASLEPCSAPALHTRTKIRGKCAFCFISKSVQRPRVDFPELSSFLIKITTFVLPFMRRRVFLRILEFVLLVDDGLPVVPVLQIFDFLLTVTNSSYRSSQLLHSPNVLFFGFY